MRALLASVLTALLALASATPIAAEDNPLEPLAGFPALVTLHGWYPPTVASVMGKTIVFYEIYLLNAYGAELHLQELDVSGGGTQRSFTGDKLGAMVSPLGVPGAKPSTTIPAGLTAVIYLALEYPAAQAVPATLTDSIRFTVPKVGTTMFRVAQLPLTVSRRPPIAILPPLRGAGWFAGSGPGNDSNHRRTVFYDNGRPFIGQRFAIDWLQAHAAGKTWRFYHGDVFKNEDWYCYNQPLYAVADGTVVAEKTNIPDNIPMQKPVVPITQETIGGNYLVIDIGYGRYAFYAHMIPGSATVKLGDHVNAGQIVGRLGNSGNSTAPHLHFHIVDAPQFLFAEGEPYVFPTLHAAQGDVSQSTDDDPSFTLPGPFATYHNTMPGDNAVVDFGKR